MTFELVLDYVFLCVVEFMHTDAFNVFRNKHYGIIVFETGVQLWDRNIRVLFDVLQSRRFIKQTFIVHSRDVNRAFEWANLPF
jgi:hypothetical protein